MATPRASPPGHETRLTTRGDVRTAVPSPAGAAGQIAFTVGTGNDTEIYLLEASTGREQRLTTNQLYDGQPDWSPDGQTLVFARGDMSRAPGGQDNDLFLVGEVWRMDADGGNARRLTTGRNPTWAPDGRRIAFLTNGVEPEPGRPRRGNELRLINWEGQNEWTVLEIADIPREVDLGGAIFQPGPEGLGTVAWTGGGRALAVSAWGSFGIVVSVSDQARDVTIVAGVHEGGVGRLSGEPGGSRIAYEVLSPSGWTFTEIAPYTLRAAQQAGRVRIGGPRAEVQTTRPAWSPDGGRLALVTGNDPEDPGEALTIYSADGQEVGSLATGRITAVAWD